MSVARVPFALVGVLLLLGSATFAGSVGTPTVSEPSVDRAIDRTEAATQSAVRDGVSTAAVQAARHPVTVRADSEAGVVLGQSDTFRDALRLRIFLRVRENLDRITTRRDDVTVRASLPSTPTVSELEEEMQRVSITRAGPNETNLRATVENVTLTARRNGNVVGQRTVSPTVTVPVPTLAVHDRVSTFEQRLDAGPDERGLGSRLTAQLYALTWTRGYAQYGGVPIENVVANRHLALLTNSNALTMQRQHFGESDPRGGRILRWATANTALTDAIDGAGTPVADRLSRAHDYAGLDRLPSTLLENAGATDPSVAPEDDVEIEVGPSADSAFVETIENLQEHVEESYTTRVQRRVTVVDQTETVLQEPAEPEPDWELVSKDVSQQRSVGARQSQEPTPDGPWHVFEYYPRQVSLRTTIERTWNTSNGQTTTVEERRQRGDVDVLILGRHDGGPAPHRPFETVHENGGPLDGPNLDGIEGKARRQLLALTSVDALAVRGLEEDGTRTTDSVTGDRPDNIQQYVYRDLADFRDEVRQLSVTAQRGRLSTMQVNPGQRLAGKLEAEWDRLLDVPEQYEAMPDRARANARELFLRAVYDRLQERAGRHDEGREKLTEELNDRDLRSLGAMQSDYDNRGSSADADDTELQMRVETAPSYLTLGQLDGSSVRSLPPGTTTNPLVARNVNLFTAPYGDLASGLVRSLLGPEQVRLQTAAQTLQAAEQASDSADDPPPTVAEFRKKVKSANGYLAGRAATALGGVDEVAYNAGGTAVEEALKEWDSPGEQAEAWVDGDAVAAIHDEATDRFNLSETGSDQARLLLRVAIRTGLSNDPAQVAKPVVNGTAKVMKDAIQQEAETALGDRLSAEMKAQLEDATGRTLSRLPAGMPLFPPFGPWVTTINYWQVAVRGQYTRFSVSVPRGTPDDPGGRFRYIRDSGTVRLDVDEDGTREPIGRTTPVSFSTHTSVAIAVPPGMRGVGDVDGVMDEQSPGWPDAG